MLNLNQWLAKIEKLHAQTIKLGLERVTQIALDLNLTNFECPVITVGGTNGKGSCVKFLESILNANGCKVGTYTSPHLLTFNERIRIDNKLISDEKLCEAFTVIDQARNNTPLTFFEFITLAALWIFKQAKLDALILEVGMGGRLDVVNIVDADIAIIASIDLDHTEYLGTTREQIGYEKAGIFRGGKIAICGDTSPPESLLSFAQDLNCQLFCVNRDFTYSQTIHDWSFKTETFKMAKLPILNLPIANAASVLMAVSKLRDRMDISVTAIYEGLKSAKLMGRFQVLENPYPCILDVAHNPASAKMLAEKVQNFNSKGKLLAVVGMLKDKDIQNTLSPLTPYITNWFLGNINVTRGATSEFLSTHLKDFGVSKWYTYSCIPDAFKAAANSLKPDDKILVFGSFHTVSEVLQYCGVGETEVNQE